MSRHPTLPFVLPLLALCAGAAAARDVVPASPGGGPGESLFALDNGPQPGARPGRYASGLAAGAPQAWPSLRSLPVDKAAKAYDSLGGDDVLITENTSLSGCSMDIASNGDIYVAVERRRADSDGAYIEVYRSEDHGNTFRLWGTLGGAYLEYFQDPQLRVVEGAIARVFVAFSAANASTDHDAQVWLAGSPLGGAAAIFGTPVVVMAQTDVNFYDVRFDTDVSGFNSFYVYVVAQGNELGLPTGADIWFARSTNQGASFETAYMLATLAVPDRHYSQPDIAYGYGGHLHVCWDFFSADGSFDASVRYRHASSYASGGLSSWDPWVTMTSTSDGYFDLHQRIGASHAGSTVVLCHSRLTGTSPWLEYEDTRLRISSDAGATWGTTVTRDGPYLPGPIVENAALGLWYLSGLDYGSAHLYTASATNLAVWTEAGEFTDAPHAGPTIYAPGFALDPVKDDRPAMAWTLKSNDDDPDPLWFDAAWRDDPGYPNLEPGFPLGVFGAPRSAPALVDLDGDGDLEIVYADTENLVQAIRADNSSLPGWPVNVGATLSDGPVAIGDLDGDGVPTAVVGTTDGRVFAYSPAGALLPGWPTSLAGATGGVYVSIGALGGPYPRTVVACCGNRLYFRSHHGATPPGVPAWTFGAAYAFAAPAAIGDIDDDGVSEVVGGLGQSIFALEMRGAALQFSAALGALLSDAVTLADLDLDGDLEILCPTSNGVLHVRDHTGAAVGGNFPYNTGVSYPLTSAAVAQCLGQVQPEIAFGRQDYAVHLLWDDGEPALGYPVRTGAGWWLWGAPVIGRVNGTSSDVLVGARDRNAWAWDNTGDTIEGWPKSALYYVQVSPAIGDIDEDGSAEAVFVSDSAVLVFDLNNTVTDPSRTWPMYGHDPQRTGCADCQEDLVTAVDPDESGGAITRVRLAPPSPNPVSGPATFAFAVPVRAVVSLDVFDLRGRRVATVYREETGPGPGSATWLSRDADGQPLASGEYVARLRVLGPGVDEVVTRKVMLIR